MKTNISFRLALFVWLALGVLPVVFPTTAAASYWPPDERGPYDVGVTSRLIVDESRFEIWGLRHRPIPLEIWYPAAPKGRQNNVYQMMGEIPDWGWSVLDEVYGEQLMDLLTTQTSAYRDAPPNTLDIMKTAMMSSDASTDSNSNANATNGTRLPAMWRTPTWMKAYVKTPTADAPSAKEESSSDER